MTKNTKNFHQLLTKVLFDNKLYFKINPYKFALFRGEACPSLLFF